LKIKFIPFLFDLGTVIGEIKMGIIEY